MEEIQYLNEHLWPGRIGHAGILLAFTAAILSAFSYFMSVQRADHLEEAGMWKKIGRGAFWVTQ